MAHALTTGLSEIFCLAQLRHLANIVQLMYCMARLGGKQFYIIHNYATPRQYRMLKASFGEARLQILHLQLRKSLIFC